MKQRLSAILFSIIALTSQQTAVAEPTMLSKATPKDQQIFAGIKTALLKEAALPPPLLADTDESYFWLMSARTIPLMDAYRYSHDLAFLEAFVPLMQQILTQRYIHPSKPEWNGWFHYKNGSDTPMGIAELDHETIIYYVPALMFVQEVSKDPALKSKYGKLADEWLADVQRSIWAWEKRGCWHDFDGKTGWYTFPTQYPDAKAGEMVNIEAKHAGGVAPYNKVHAMDDAMTLAYQITGDVKYRQRMEKCATFFRAHWRVDDKHAEWNYRDHAFGSDYESGVLGQGKPKTGAFVHTHPSYYVLDSHDVVLLYDQGIVFTKEDIKKLLQTNLEFMFMGDEKKPAYRMINGNYKPAGRYDKGKLWPALAHFSEKTRDLWKTELDKSNGWASASALNYLIETAQPVSWEPRLMHPGIRP